MQRHNDKLSIVAIQLVGDVLLLIFSLWLAYFFKMDVSPLAKLGDHYFFLFVFVCLLWVLVAQSANIYDTPRFASMEWILKRSLLAIVIHFAVCLVFIFSIKGFYYSRVMILYTYSFFTAFIFFWRILYNSWKKWRRKSGNNLRSVIIVGSGTIGNQLYNYFSSSLSLGYRFDGFFHNNPDQCLPGHLVRGSVKDVEGFIFDHPIDEIYCTFSLNQSKSIRWLRRIADNNLIRFRLVPDFKGFVNRNVALDFYYDTPVLTFRSEPLESAWNAFVKRVFDIVFSLSVIIVSFPFMLILILLIKVSSPGPVFFSQQRSGRNREIFTCYKFRSMVSNSSADTLQATQNDPRVTGIGKFLRKTNLDEMPQFINVLLGQMSVVGPRPHMLTHTEEYAKLINKFHVRHFVKPGITGWAQVNGYRGPLNKLNMYKRVRFDVWYIENWSLLLDVKIITRTVLNMITGERNAF